MDPETQYVGLRLRLAPGVRLSWPDGVPDERYGITARIEVAGLALDVVPAGIRITEEGANLELLLPMRVLDVAIRSV